MVLAPPPPHTAAQWDFVTRLWWLLTAWPEARPTSWWRSETRNRAVGGAPRSRHLQGLALDVVISRGFLRAFLGDVRAVGLHPLDEGDHVHIQDVPLRTAGSEVARAEPVTDLKRRPEMLRGWPVWIDEAIRSQPRGWVILQKVNGAVNRVIKESGAVARTGLITSRTLETMSRTLARRQPADFGQDPTRHFVYPATEAGIEALVTRAISGLARRRKRSTASKVGGIIGGIVGGLAVGAVGSTASVAAQIARTIASEVLVPRVLAALR